MKITLNNETREISPGTTVRKLLENEKITLYNVAVAVNGTIVLRQSWESTVLPPDAHVVIIAATYGG